MQARGSTCRPVFSGARALACSIGVRGGKGQENSQLGDGRATFRGGAVQNRHEFSQPRIVLFSLRRG